MNVPRARNTKLIRDSLIAPLTPHLVTRARGTPIVSDISLTRRAFLLAMGSLLLAGCFSLLLIFGRFPGIADKFTDPLFFKRCLVVHVDLALIVWFFSFGAGLYALQTGNAAMNRIHAFGLGAAYIGVLAMIAGMLVPGTAPILANYVPVIDNPVFIGGLALFFGGLLTAFMDGRLFTVTSPSALARNATPVPSSIVITPAAASGLKTMALAYLVAMTTFLVSWAATPTHLEARVYYELLFWGGGHILQVANVAAMLSVWLLLLSSLLNREILPARRARILFALLLAPHLIGPLLTLQGTVTPLYRLGFTRLMQFGIFPVVTVMLAICLRELWRARTEGALARQAWRDPRLIGFTASAALTVTGFLLGSAIRNSNTMIPAHYHASIGAVTVALMAVTYLLLKPMGLPLIGARWRRLIPWQLALFGFGQVIFAFGFAWGGLHGLGRKAYAAEQHVRTFGEWIGLIVMGLGGLVAVTGGLIFVFLALSAAGNFLSQRSRTANANANRKLQTATARMIP